MIIVRKSSRTLFDLANHMDGCVVHCFVRYEYILFTLGRGSGKLRAAAGPSTFCGGLPPTPPFLLAHAARATLTS
jgi:hypothetical protein